MGLQDPNPLVAGRGIALLKQNGIDVEMPKEFSEKCQKLAEIFLWHIQKKMPFVSLKIALSGDNKIAGLSGKTVAITSEEARLHARELRAGYDATMIGAETFLKDDPFLDFRQTKWEGKKSPKVVILDPNGRAQSFFQQSQMNKIVFSENIFFVKSVDKEMLKDLYQKGIYSLYVEGGAKTHQQFVDKKLFQKLYCFRSFKNLGEGLPWIAPFHKIEEITSSFVDQRSQIDKDELVVFYPN